MIFSSAVNVSVCVYLWQLSIHLALLSPYPYSDYLFKLLLIGDSGVGKSCLLLRFAVSVCFGLVVT